MARKATPQPLSISSSQREAAGEEGDTLDAGPKSSSQSLKSPRSPRSPFRFSTKLGQGFGDQHSMHASDRQEHRRDHPLSPTSTSLPSPQEPQVAARQTSRDRGRILDRPATSPAKGGFFSNYIASKSSSRLQPSETQAAQPGGSAMSRESDRPALPGKTLSSDRNRSGETHSISGVIFRNPLQYTESVLREADRSVDKSLTRRPVGGGSSRRISLGATRSWVSS